jgi:UDP-N-acetylglucosamine:LPS N-acetylglucosamine transferase
MKINYIIIAGSSGGHILPAISLINNLSNTKKKIVFITNAEGLNFIPLINNQDCIVKVFEQSNKIKIIFSQFTNCFHYFIKNKNVKVIGFGGFLSVMPIFLGRLFNFILKHNLIYIHEQNNMVCIVATEVYIDVHDIMVCIDAYICIYIESFPFTNSETAHDVIACIYILV